MRVRFATMILLAASGLAAAAGPARAANDVMKVCGAKYQAAKANKTLPAGQTWAQYLAQCRGTVSAAATAPAPAAKSAPVAAAAPVAAPASAAAKASHLPSAQSPAMAAMHDRQRQCGAQWKTDKAAGKVPAGQTWPQYWSACNKRLKG